MVEDAYAEVAWVEDPRAKDPWHGRKFPKRLDTRAEVARSEVDPMTWAEVA